MPVSPRTFRPRNTSFSPRQISGLSLWLDAADSASLYQTEEGPRTAVASPLEIAGCALWLDASDAGSITQSGGVVSQWNDKSGNGKNATAAGSARPTFSAAAQNGLSALTFNGSSNTMQVASITLPTYITVFVVSSTTRTGSNLKFLMEHSAGIGSNPGFFFNGTNNAAWAFNRSGAFHDGPTVDNSDWIGSGWALASLTYDGVGTIYKNGASVSSATYSGTARSNSNVTDALNIGSRNQSSLFLTGSIGEIVIYNSRLSPADRARVEAYLGAKWGISTPAATKAAASNDPVAYWGDKSGNGRHVTQATAANRPVVATNAQNGRNALTFDGTNDSLRSGSATLSSSLTYMGVFRFNSDYSSGSPRIVDAGAYPGTRAGELYLNAANQLGMYSGGIVTSSSLPTNSYRTFGVWLAQFSSTDAKIGLNGITTYAGQSNTGTNAGSRITVGADGNVATGAFSNVSFAELIVINRTMSAPERQRIEGYLAWKWGLQQQLPWNHPYAAAFPGYGSQTVVTDSDARAYLTAVATADGGTGVEVCVARAIDDFVVQSKADGIWSAIKASCILCGARTLAGALVPLAGAAPTNNNFVAADYSRKTGLVGNGSTKYLNSNRSNSADGQNDNHVCAYKTVVGDAYGSAYIGAQETASSYTITGSGGQYNKSGTIGAAGNYTSVSGLFANSRASSSVVSQRIGAQAYDYVNTSVTPNTALNIFVFARTDLNGSAVGISNARLSFYSIGSSLNLATLDTRVSALYQGITYALNTGLSPLGYDTDTLAYLNAGYAAGGTLA